MVKDTASLVYSKNVFLNSNSVPIKRSLSFANSIYALAAKTVKNTKDRSVNFKHVFNLMHMDKKFMRPVYEICCKVIDNWIVCHELFENSGILSEHPNVDKNLLRVVVSELFWGNKKIEGEGEVFDIVREKKEILTNLRKQQIEEGRDDRFRVFYVRVNLLKMSVEEVLTHLNDMGYMLIETPSKYEEYLKMVKQLEPDSFMIDFHFKDLFVFNTKATPVLAAHSLFNDKLIIFQSKSNVVPVFLMDVKPGNIVLDMCAAPGKQTSLIAAQLRGSGKVWAVDKSPKQYNNMITFLNQCGAQKYTHFVNCDVLNLECCPQDFDVILLNPNSSGSGLEWAKLGIECCKPEKLKNNQMIQKKLLMDALTKYPTVKRVVYCTSSIYAEENEAVVDYVMERLKDNLCYELINSHTFISGFSKGLDTYKCGSFCMKLSAEQDFVRGVFVAVFDRTSTVSKTEEIEEDGPEEVYEGVESSNVEIPQTETSLKKKKGNNMAKDKKSKQGKTSITEEHFAESNEEENVSSEIEFFQSQKSLIKKKIKKTSKDKTPAKKPKQEKTPIEITKDDTDNIGEENGSSEVEILQSQTSLKKKKRKNSAQDKTPAKKPKSGKTLMEIMNDGTGSIEKENGSSEIEILQSQTSLKKNSAQDKTPKKKSKWVVTPM